MIEDPQDTLPEGSNEEAEAPRIPTVGGTSEETSTDIQEEEPMARSSTGTDTEYADASEQAVEDNSQNIETPMHLTADMEPPANRAPWPVYKDPTAPATGARLRQERKEREMQESVEGETYTFMGHSNKYNETRKLVTREGSVKIGQTIKLSTDELERLRGLGFRFDTAAPSS